MSVRVQLTTSEGLVALYMLADYQRVRGTNSGPPQPGWFARHAVFTGINASNRGTVTRALAAGCCVYCRGSVTNGSTGDHVLALDDGGPAGLENFMPCCRSCNSSKGSKDLLVWWHSRGLAFASLEPDVLITYCRLAFANAVRLRKPTAPASDALAVAVRELAACLPSDEHRSEARRRVVGVVGKRWDR